MPEKPIRVNSPADKPAKALPASAGQLKDDHSLEEQVMLFQLLQRHAEQIQAQGQMVQQKLIETMATEQAVSDLGKGGEALIPLGSGVFMNGSATTGLLLNIGSGIFLPTTP
ncbi:MAG TPA: hypothetical protein VJB16_05240, partial [archaeon]|nr:hypothetical protein [archaeon]